MEELTLPEIKSELDSIAVQLCLLEDFIQSFSFCLFETLGETLSPEQILALKQNFLETLKEQQYQSLDELSNTVPAATVSRNRFRVHRNIEILRKMYGLA